MPRLRLFRAYADALGAVVRNAHWLLLIAFPLFVLHAYVVMLTNPLIRVAFVNSFLKPADALASGGYEIRFLGGNWIEPGPGYSFPPGLTVVVLVLEAIALIAFVASAQRRLLGETRNPGLQFSWLSRLLASAGLVVVLFAFLVIFVPQLELIGIMLPTASARLWTLQFVPSPFAELLGMAFWLLAGWALIKLGTVLLAIAQNDGRCLRRAMLPAVRADFWRTISLILVLAVSFALVQAVPPLLEKAYVPGRMPQDYLGIQIVVFTALLLHFLFMRASSLIVLSGIAFAAVQLLPLLIQRAYFEPGQIPLGFHGVQVYALSALVLEFWFMLVFFLALLCALYSHYRAELKAEVKPWASTTHLGPRAGNGFARGPAPENAPIALQRGSPFGRRPDALALQMASSGLPSSPRSPDGFFEGP